MPGPKQKFNIHQPLSLSCCDAPKPAFFCPGQDLLCMSRGYNLMVRRRQTGLYGGLAWNIY